MKNKFLLTLAVAMAVVMLLAACGKKTETGGEATKPEEQTGAVVDSIFNTDTPSTGEGAQTTDPTDPTDSRSDPTKPTGGETTPTQPDTKPEPTTPGGSSQVDTSAVDYEQFQAMSAAEQQAFAEAFETPEAFFVWLNEKRKAYEQENPSIEIDDSGVVDMEDLLN